MENNKKQTEKRTAGRVGTNIYKRPVRGCDVGKAVDGFFKARGFSMPHNLRHGVGLEAHEAPSLFSKDSNRWTLEPGMVVTVEPGLCETGAGGSRLENDILVTADGSETLTRSRIVLL
jgi:Xaa-Pro dipeptidase